MLAVAAGAWHSWTQRAVFVEAALYSEGLNLSAPIKTSIGDYYRKLGVMPSDNDDIGLTFSKNVSDSNVKRIAVNQGGVLIVDFAERIGEKSLILIPKPVPANTLLNWTCISDSIDASVLAKLVPVCHFQPPGNQKVKHH